LSLPVDLLCDRAIRLAVTDFTSDRPAAQQLRDSLRQLSGNLAQLESARNSTNLVNAQSVLTQVLAEREYQGDAVKPNWWQVLGVKVMYWLTRLAALLGKIPGAERIGQVGFYIVVGLLLLPLVGLMIYLIRRQLQRRRDVPELAETTSVAAF
jgi:hypothetical protein